MAAVRTTPFKPKMGTLHVEKLSPERETRVVTALVLDDGQGFRLQVPVGTARQLTGEQLLGVVQEAACVPLATAMWIATGEDVDLAAVYPTQRVGPRRVLAPQVSVRLADDQRPHLFLINDSTSEQTRILAPLCTEGVTPHRLHKLVETAVRARIVGIYDAATHLVLDRADKATVVPFLAPGQAAEVTLHFEVSMGVRDFMLSARREVRVPLTYACVGRTRQPPVTAEVTFLARDGRLSVVDFLRQLAVTLPPACEGYAVQALEKYKRWPDEVAYRQVEFTPGGTREAMDLRRLYNLHVAGKRREGLVSVAGGQAPSAPPRDRGHSAPVHSVRRVDVHIPQRMAGKEWTHVRATLFAKDGMLSPLFVPALEQELAAMDVPYAIAAVTDQDGRVYGRFAPGVPASNITLLTIS